MFYSEDLEEFVGQLPDEINEAIEKVRQFFSIGQITVLQYNEDSIAVRVNVNVPIPPKGTVGNIDIRESEPIIIRFLINCYPHLPIVMSDRRDFPKENISHLYATATGEPSNLCLVRNNRDEWFANHTIHDFLATVEQWFYKAATGQLTEDGEEFDPVRLEYYYGKHIYRYDMLRDIVNDDARLLPEHPYAALYSYFNPKANGDDQQLTLKTVGPIQMIELDEAVRIIKKLHSTKNEQQAEPTLTLLVWDESDTVNVQYSTNLPTTFSQLKAFLNERNVNIKKILNIHNERNDFVRAQIPIILALRRPKKLIGYDGCYEFFNFILVHTGAGVKIKDDAKVKIQQHIEPFGKQLAMNLTGEERSASFLYIGAGSLGSKMIMHEARAGNLNISVCDPDNFLEHNLARHALFADNTGNNKAKAIIDEIGKMFQADVHKKFQAFKLNARFLLQKVFDGVDYLVDTSASMEVQNCLVEKGFPKAMKIVRAEIANEGRLGLLYFEGAGRNPRIDDLINLTYYFSLKKPFLEEWRKRDATAEASTINVGLGCSSTTTVMPDDKISIHAATFSRVIYQNSVTNINQGKGLIYFNQLEVQGLPITKSSYEIIEPFEIFSCLAKSGWEIRFAGGLTRQLLEVSQHYKPLETGGILVGVSSYKTKTIHVFDIVRQPEDSTATCVGFKRGKKGLPKQIELIKEKSGNMIGYIGEWHSHPMNLERLSELDKTTIQKLIKINRETPIPSLAVIVTPYKILPFVYE